MLNSFFCLAQQITTVIPPSPEAASLFKSSEIPVNQFTGRTNIDIPVLSLQRSGGEIPISLIYNASGIKVNEISSRVGLGWSLITGGMITREVRGIPDDNSEGYINTSNLVDDYSGLSAEEKTNMLNSTLQGNQDYESDIYHFNFLDKQGKFHFSQKGDVIVHHKNDLIIIPVRNLQNKIIGWHIITPDGIEYTFGIMPNTPELATENKTNYVYTFGQQLPFHNPGLFDFTSSWYLTQIKDVDGRETIFTYSKDLESTVEYWDVLNHDKEFPSFNTTTCNNHSENLRFSQNEYHPIFLDRIENDFGKVEFNYLHAREDLINDFALTSIELYNDQNIKVDHFDLDYGYFISDDGNDYQNYGIPAQRNKRLYLDRVTQVNGVEFNKEYVLEYYIDHLLPNRFSFSQDLWGYYNGQDNDELFPEVEINTGSKYITINGGDRKVYQEFVNACSLKSITYPTKGKAELVYESNDLTGEEGFYIGTQYQESLIPGGTLANIVGLDYADQSFSSDFTLTSSFPYNNIVDYSVTVDFPCDYDLNDCPTIEIFESDGTTLVVTLNTETYQGSLNMSDGDYVLKITNGPFQTDNNVQVSLYGRELIPNVNGNALTGGLRIKDILYKNYDGELFKKVSYNYNRFDENQVSSGLSLNPPTFLFFNAPVSSLDNGGGSNCSKNILSSNTVFPLCGQSSSHVGYTNVTEIYNDGLNGRVEYTFLFTPDPQLNGDNIFEWGNIDYPIVPSWDYSHRRGLLLKKAIFESSNDSPIMEHNYYYNGGGDTNEYDISAKNIAMSSIASYDGAEYYSNLSEKYYKTNEVIREYRSSGTIVQTKHFDYEAGYEGRTFPLTVTTTDSKGNNIIVRRYYPDDVTAINSLKGGALSDEAYSAALKFQKDGTNPRLGIALQTETIKNEVSTIRRINYRDWGNGLILPEKVKEKKGTTLIEDKAVVISYDEEGNVLESLKKDGAPISYIWGYGQKYLVAEVKNATRSQIESIQGFGINFHTGSEGLTINQENLLRAIPNTLVTTYTYQPLVGIESITDPSGKIVFYEYDNFKRLKLIRDSEGNILTEFKYNYKD